MLTYKKFAQCPVGGNNKKSIPQTQESFPLWYCGVSPPRRQLKIRVAWLIVHEVSVKRPALCQDTEKMAQSTHFIRELK